MIGFLFYGMVNKYLLYEIRVICLFWFKIVVLFKRYSVYSELMSKHIC